VVHAVFVQLWREPERYDPRRGGFPGWLLAATHHEALEATRQHPGARRGREELAAQTARGGEGAPVGDRGARARQALGALPAAEREALILAFFAGHTQQEIAADTGLPIEAVRDSMVCGMRELRARLDDTASAEVQP
jgi:RNA polymerase sigma factor (sigma-70 family)